MLFLENFASILLGAHLVAAVITLIALLASTSYLIFASEKEWGTGVKAALYGAYGYLASFILGLLIYPTFRVNVRAENFDKVKPWATGLFEVKEHIGSIALFAVLGIMILASTTNEKSTKERKRLFTFLVGVITAIFIFKFISGFILAGLDKI